MPLRQKAIVLQQPNDLLVRGAQQVRDLSLFQITRSMRMPPGGTSLLPRTYWADSYSSDFFEAGLFLTARSFPRFGTIPALMDTAIA